MESPTTTTVFSTKRLASRKNISRLNIRDFAGWWLRSFFLKVKFLLLRGEREALLARREFLQQLALWEEDVRIPLPGGKWLWRRWWSLMFSAACFQNDRDRLREFLISWFEISAKKQPWYRWEMIVNLINDRDATSSGWVLSSFGVNARMMMVSAVWEQWDFLTDRKKLVHHDRYLCTFADMQPVSTFNKFNFSMDPTNHFIFNSPLVSICLIFSKNYNK